MYSNWFIDEGVTWNNLFTSSQRCSSRDSSLGLKIQF